MRILLAIIVGLSFLLLPANHRLMSSGDDDDYFAVATALAFGKFPSFANEYHVGEKMPFGSVGPGMLAAPFVAAFSLGDHMAGASIVFKREKENRYWTWSLLGFSFSVYFYLLLGCCFLYRALLYWGSRQAALITSFLSIAAGGGLLIYAFRRPVMSHVFEFLTVSLAVLLLSRRLKRGEWRWMSEVVGSCAALIFLTRYNNAFLAAGLMASFLYLFFRESKKLPVAQTIRMAVPFLILVLIFRVLPVLVNGYSSFDQGYAGTLGRLLPETDLAFYWNRAGDILFGWDMGMLFTAPALLLGLAAMWRYKSNLPGEVMFLASLALLNIYFTMGWRSFGSFYGYRYICFTAMPLLAVPLVLMVDDLLQAVSKLRVWVMAAMLSWLPLMSMMAFERSEKFAFSLITNEYGVQTYSQPTYHLDLLQNLLLDPFATLSRAALTGVGAFFWAGLSPQQMGQRLLLYIGPPLLFCMLYLVRKSLFGTKPPAQSGRVTTPMKDARFPVGEFFIGETHAEKYQSSNWIARRLVGNFMANILATVRTAGNQDVHEIGCGEGHILGLLAGKGFKVAGCDISDSSLAVAAREARRHGFVIPLAKQSIYELDSSRDAADTVLCCEVLEHLTDPEAGLRQLLAITRKDLIVSVPNEPVWHLLNILRGKYLTALGNTPGHFQHWSSRQFVEFVGRYAEIVSVKKPLPWTLVHCRPRRKDEQ